MTTFLDRFLVSKQERKKINFADILDDKEGLLVIFTGDALINYRILQHIASWRDDFNRFEFCFDSFQEAFFGRMSSFPGMKISRLSTISGMNNNIVLSFRDDNATRKFLSKLNNSIVVDIGNQGNLQFYPDSGDLLQIIRGFSEFTNLKYHAANLDFTFRKSDATKARYNFFHNKFHNVVLDISETRIFKNIDDIIVTLKQNFPANVYLTGRTLKKNPFISVRNYRPDDLLKLYCMARESDLFLTDDVEKFRLFSYFGLKQFCLTRLDPDNSGYLDPFDLDKLISTISSSFTK